jgi:hypothetical protein
VSEQAKRTATKAARLILLRNLRRLGYLEGMTLEQIGNRLHVNRSTILRDLRDLDGIEPELERLRATWRGLPVPRGEEEHGPIRTTGKPGS